MVSETNFNLFDQNLNTEQKIETFSTTRDRTNFLYSHFFMKKG